MATIQAKISRGHKYWYIVESRRVNGKPRPVVLAYLGKPDDLLRLLQGLKRQVVWMRCLRQHLQCALQGSLSATQPPVGRHSVK